MLVHVNQFRSTVSDHKGKNIHVPTLCVGGEELTAAGTTTPAHEDALFVEISTDTAIVVSDAYIDEAEGTVHPRMVPANSVVFLPVVAKGQTYTFAEPA